MKLIGVYNANGGLIGELSYVLGKLLGTRSCSLCSLSHDLIREKQHFKNWRQSLPIDFDLLHLNELDEGVLRTVDGRVPCVIWVEGEKIGDILTDEALRQMSGDEALLMSAVDEWLSTRQFEDSSS